MRFLINLTASATIAAAASFSARIAAPCPTNTVPWPCGDGGTTCEPFAAAKKNALKWLRKNAPPSDLYNAATLFGTLGGVDGMDAGVAAVAANATLTAKARWPWARSVPCDVFRDYVLPYACANEPRTLMMNVSPLPDASLPPSSAARLVTDSVCPSSCLPSARLQMMMDSSSPPDASRPPSSAARHQTDSVCPCSTSDRRDSAARQKTGFGCPCSTSDRRDGAATSCSVVGCTFTYPAPWAASRRSGDVKFVLNLPRRGAP